MAARWFIQLSIWFLAALPFAPSLCEMVLNLRNCLVEDSEPLLCEGFMALAPAFEVFDPQPGGSLPPEWPDYLLTAALLSLTITAALALLTWRRARRAALARELAAAAFEG
ncbi:MAG: hypothetical protein ACREEW_12810 [Caulobacteraceae bacterium]